jgi:hypothetical protein
MIRHTEQFLHPDCDCFRNWVRFNLILGQLGRLIDTTRPTPELFEPNDEHAELTQRYN